MFPLQSARCIVMRDRAVSVGPRQSDEDDDENDAMHVSSYLPTNRSSKYPCHIILKAIRDNDVDPYDYECDIDMEDDDDDDDYSHGASILEEDTSCSSESSASDDEEVPSSPLQHHHHAHDSPHSHDPQTIHSQCRTVRFCAPLVTASYVRPVTTVLEKYELYYTERDYREFRRNYVSYTRSQQQQPPPHNRSHGHHPNTTTNTNTNATRRNAPVVQFHVNVITAVHFTSINSDDCNPSELYYSKGELQGFLDDFVASLSKGV